jgi:superfamily II DNA or RNA helicase
MSDVVLNEKFLAQIAGWEAMKHARALLETGQVLSSNWTPPVLKGVVQEGSISYRSGLAIKNERDIENMCSCRDSRQWGTICAHSIAVGLHHLRRVALAATPARSEPRAQTAAHSQIPKSAPSGRRLRRDSATGEPLEINLIFPPNLPQALVKGRIMLCLEGQWRGGRAPLNALATTATFRLNAQDAAFLEGVEELADGQSPGMILLEPAQLIGLLAKLADHPRTTIGKSQSLTISKTPWCPPLSIRLEDSGEISVRLKSNQSLPALLQDAERAWALVGTMLQPVPLTGITRDCLKAPVRLPRTRVPQFLMQDWPALQAAGQIDSNFKAEDFSFEPRPPKFLLHLTGGLAQLQALLQCAYSPRIMTAGVTSPDESLWLPDPDDPRRYSTRDLASERKALGRLLSAGFIGPDSQGRLQMSGQNAVLNFFARDYPRLQSEWEITMEERLERSTAQNLERIEPRFQITPSGEQWFDLNVSYQSSTGEQFSAADIQRLLRSGQGHTRLKNGKFAMIDTGAVEELQEVLLDCAPRQHAEGYRIHQIQAGFLDHALRDLGMSKVAAPGSWRERVGKQTGEATLEPPALGELESVLRPYQKHGVGWLAFLRQNGFGGILADEMGLGKTLQTLAFFVATRRQETSLKPVLIVCPKTLVFNWVAEAKKFTPELRVLALDGPGRHELFARIPEHDVIVTSYALVRRDAERYRELEFDTVVLDEAQHIKNRQTQNAQAVKAVRSQHRLVLTGTPLENSVLDLWSIFDFLMPGYLGSAQDFRERYEVPIAREKDSTAQARLARRLRPFMLRRLKREVATELPEKLEQVAFCELTEAQAALYRQILEASRQEVMAAVGEQGMARSRMLVLTALLRLRQICCDLRLLKMEGTEADGASGKLEMFSELLEEVIDGGHRVLVFSQFVEMLKLIQQRLETEGVEFCYLDGATSNRAEVVDRFQKNAEIPVFLISLKAGGVGLNLTGADTVIHFDPWWNPAVEDQATDRAHRIGQTRVVTSYKLIARGTVEEKILNLQARKREVIQAMLGGEQALAESLNWDEIQELLAG